MLFIYINNLTCLFLIFLGYEDFLHLLAKALFELVLLLDCNFRRHLHDYVLRVFWSQKLRFRQKRLFGSLISKLLLLSRIVVHFNIIISLIAMKLTKGLLAYGITSYYFLKHPELLHDTKQRRLKLPALEAGCSKYVIAHRGGSMENPENTLQAF